MPESTVQRKGRAIWDQAGMLVVFVVLFAACSLFVDKFFSWRNFVGLSLSVSLVGMVACTMLFCLASGDFDLSVEAVVAFAGVLAAIIINRTGSITLGILAGILAGGLVGLVNGVVISRLGINALITTLATMQIVRGLGFIVSDGRAVGVVQESFFGLGTSSFPVITTTQAGQSAVLFAGIPTPVWITIFCFAVFAFLLNRTVFGRNTLAIGGNREAARLAGIPVEWTKITIFSLQGLMAGFAGVVLASRIASGQPNASVGFSLDVISACVLGGVSLSGGIATMHGVIVGVLIMGTIQNAMDLSNVPTFYQYVARGSVLLAAVTFDQLKRRK